MQESEKIEPILVSGGKDIKVFDTVHAVDNHSVPFRHALEVEGKLVCLSDTGAQELIKAMMKNWFGW